jgi:hypothetical protein
VSSEVQVGARTHGVLASIWLQLEKSGWQGGTRENYIFYVIQVVAFVNGSWFFHLVGVGTLRELVLPSSGC